MSKRIDFDKLEEAVQNGAIRFREADEYDDDLLGYDDAYDGEMEDVEDSEMEDDYLADCFPTRYEEFQDDDGEYAFFDPVQKGDSESRTIAASYADNLNSGDNAPETEAGRPLGGEDLDDRGNRNTQFAMYDEADLDNWSHE